MYANNDDNVPVVSTQDYVASFLGVVGLSNFFLLCTIFCSSSQAALNSSRAPAKDGWIRSIISQIEHVPQEMTLDPQKLVILWSPLQLQKPALENLRDCTTFPQIAKSFNLQARLSVQPNCPLGVCSGIKRKTEPRQMLSPDLQPEAHPRYTEPTQGHLQPPWDRCSFALVSLQLVMDLCGILLNRTVEFYGIWMWVCILYSAPMTWIMEDRVKANCILQKTHYWKVG